MDFIFLLKKIVSMFLMPFPLGFFLLILGLLFLYKRKFLKAKVMLVLSLTWFFLITYTPFIDQLLYKYETLYPMLKKAPFNIEYIYVLGNGHHTDDTLPITSQVSEIASVRLNEGIRLYQQLKKKPTLIVSGYTGLYDPTPGAVLQKKLLLSLGIHEDKIHLEPAPKDTQEEAKAAKSYIKDKPFILVTSASHMKRAMKYFHHLGLYPLAAPTNHLASIQNPNYFEFFSANALRKATILWHEILGLLFQKIKGL
ncbi:MAG: YdcF family protein [Sulfurovum sp.]|nr:YdcF family protein [Sulfurovum sp.]